MVSCMLVVCDGGAGRPGERHPLRGNDFVKNRGCARGISGRQLEGLSVPAYLHLNLTRSRKHIKRNRALDLVFCSIPKLQFLRHDLHAAEDMQHPLHFCCDDGFNNSRFGPVPGWVDDDPCDLWAGAIHPAGIPLLLRSMRC